MIAFGAHFFDGVGISEIVFMGLFIVDNAIQVGTDLVRAAFGKIMAGETGLGQGLAAFGIGFGQ